MQMNNIGFKGVLIKDKEVTVDKVKEKFQQVQCDDKYLKFEQKGKFVKLSDIMENPITLKASDNELMAHDAKLYMDLNKMGYNNLVFTGKHAESTRLALANVGIETQVEN